MWKSWLERRLCVSLRQMAPNQTDDVFFFPSNRLWCVQVALTGSSLCLFQMLQRGGRYFLSSSATCLWPRMCVLMTWWLGPTSILEQKWVTFSLIFLHNRTINNYHSSLKHVTQILPFPKNNREVSAEFCPGKNKRFLEKSVNCNKLVLRIFIIKVIFLCCCPTR